MATAALSLATEVLKLNVRAHTKCMMQLLSDFNCGIQYGSVHSFSAGNPNLKKRLL